MKTLVSLVLLCHLVPGCGGGGDGSTPTPEAPDTPTDPDVVGTPGPGGPWDPATGTATIRGVVKFSGEAPRRRPIDMGADAKCKALHPTPLTDESIVVNDNATLANCFVWIKTGLEDIEFPTPSEPGVLDQKGCRYEPHVQGIQVKQPLVIRNSDSFLHNVHSLAQNNQPINFGQSRQGAERTFQFRRAEVMVKVKCDVHGWMSSYIGVVDHPFHAVTADDGSFELKGLPPGKYSLEVWHEVLGTKSAEVTLADNENKEITLTFEES